APLVLGGAVFFGTATKIEKHTINTLGDLTTQSNAGTTGTYFEVITDGASLFTWRSATNQLNSRNPSNLNSIWSRNVTPTVAFALDASGKLSWMADPNGTTYRAFTMDCSGRLFGATNGVTGTQSLVYALITDDRGLADTVWPSYRLDARNTGNVLSPKYGIL